MMGKNGEYYQKLG